MAWLKQQSKQALQAGYPDEIAKAVHVMADDEAKGSLRPAALPNTPANLPIAAPVRPPKTTQNPKSEDRVAEPPEGALAPSPFLEEMSDSNTAQEPIETMHEPVDAPLQSAPPETLPVIPEEKVSLPQPSVPEVTQPMKEKEAPEYQISDAEEKSLKEALLPKHRFGFGGPVKQESIEPLPDPVKITGSTSLAQRRKMLLFLGGLIAVIIAALAGGVWWYRAHGGKIPLIDRDTISTGTSPIVGLSANQDIPPLPSTPTTHYAVDQPNLLSFDTETVTAESIKTELLKVALRVKEDNAAKPVEFLIRDQNFNPIAFPRFAYLLDLGLTPEFLASLDESFSLFIMNDKGYQRIGLSVKVKNPENFTRALKIREATLPKALENLFLDMTTAPKSGLTFRSSTYRDQAIRYVNIDPALSLSIDSTVMGHQWILGTSQNTLRALIDRGE